MAGGLYVPTGISLITVLIRPQDWGKAIGIHELAPNLALITVPFLATLALAAGSWRLGYLSVSVVLALPGVTYALIGVDSRERPTPPDLSRDRGIVIIDAMGVRGGCAHSKDEYIELDGIVPNVHLMCEIVRGFAEDRIT